MKFGCSSEEAFILGILANDTSNELSTMKRVDSLWFSIGCNKFFLQPKFHFSYKLSPLGLIRIFSFLTYQMPRSVFVTLIWFFLLFQNTNNFRVWKAHNQIQIFLWEEFGQGNNVGPNVGTMCTVVEFLLA